MKWWETVFWVLWLVLADVLLTLLIWLEATFKAQRRRKQGLCADYVVEGLRRKIIFCTRQTLGHKVHAFTSNPEQAMLQDARLREQGL